MEGACGGVRFIPGEKMGRILGNNYRSVNGGVTSFRRVYIQSDHESRLGRDMVDGGEHSGSYLVKSPAGGQHGN